MVRIKKEDIELSTEIVNKIYNPAHRGWAGLHDNANVRLADEDRIFNSKLLKSCGLCYYGVKDYDDISKVIKMMSSYKKKYQKIEVGTSLSGSGNVQMYLNIKDNKYTIYCVTIFIDLENNYKLFKKILPFTNNDKQIVKTKLEREKRNLKFCEENIKFLKKCLKLFENKEEK